MKKLLLALLVIASSVAGQECLVNFTNVTAASRVAVFDNRGSHCQTFNLSYSATGFTALSIEIDSAPDNGGAAGTWGIVTSVPIYGNNPSIVATDGSVSIRFYAAWVSINVTSVTGTGSLQGALSGYKGSNVYANLGGTTSSGGTVAPAYSPNQTVSGCGVEYVSGLNFTVGACNYIIAGVNYASPLTSVTLTAADPTNDRIDVIGVNTSNAVFTIVGTPSATPQQPTIDPSTQLQLTFVYVAANATTPTNVVTDNIFDEGTEWTTTYSSNIALSTSNPYHLTKDSEATNAALNNSITFVKPAAATIDLATRNNLVFYIRSKGTWPAGTSGAAAARYLSLYWLNGTTQKGVQVLLKDGQFGFSSSTTASYQQITIPTSLFGNAGIPVTTLKIVASGPTGSATFGWYIDEVTLQGGVATTTTTPVTHSINFVIDNGGTAITTGDIKSYPSVNFSCSNFTSAILSSDVSGSISIDVWKRNAAIPTVTQKISGTTPLTLTTAQLNQGISISGWNTPVTANDVFGFNVASATTVTRVTGQIFCQ